MAISYFRWRLSQNYFKSIPNLPLCCIAESHNLELDIDIAGDLAMLKKNLAKFKKGKHGKGLQDILIEELDWVSGVDQTVTSFHLSCTRRRRINKNLVNLFS